MANGRSRATILTRKGADGPRLQPQIALPESDSRCEGGPAKLARPFDGVKIRGRTALKIAVSLVALAVAAAILRDVDIGEVISILLGANPTVLLAALLAVAAGAFLRLARWKYMLAPAKAVALSTLVAPLFVAWAISNITVGPVGAVPRIFLLNRRTGISGTFSAGVLLLEYFLDTAAVLIWASMIPFLVNIAPEFHEVQIALIPASGLFLLFGFILGRRKSFLVGPLKLLQNWKKVLRLPDWITTRVEAFDDGLSASLCLPRTRFAVVATTIIIWANEALICWLLLQSLGIPFTFLQASAIMAFSHLVTGILSVPGSVGTLEVAVVTLVLAVGGQHAAALAYAILLHLFLLGPITLVGLVFAWREGWRFGKSPSHL